MKGAETGEVAGSQFVVELTSHCKDFGSDSEDESGPSQEIEATQALSMQLIQYKEILVRNKIINQVTEWVGKRNSYCRKLSKPLGLEELRVNY